MRSSFQLFEKRLYTFLHATGLATPTRAERTHTHLSNIDKIFNKPSGYPGLGPCADNVAAARANVQFVHRWYARFLPG